MEDVGSVGACALRYFLASTLSCQNLRKRPRKEVTRAYQLNTKWSNHGQSVIWNQEFLELSHEPERSGYEGHGLSHLARNFGMKQVDKGPIATVKTSRS